MSAPRPGFPSQQRGGVGPSTDGGAGAAQHHGRRPREERARERVERARTPSASSAGTASLVDDERVQMALLGAGSGVVAGVIGSAVAGVDPVAPAVAGAVVGGAGGVTVAELELGVGASTALHR